MFIREQFPRLFSQGDINGATPCMLSCNINVEVVQFFIDFYFHKNQSEAFIKKDRRLIEEEIMLEADSLGNSLISNAVASGKVDIVQWMLERCPQVVRKHAVVNLGLKSGGLYCIAVMNGQT